MTNLRQLLVEICSDLGSDDLDKMKFLLKDVTGSAKLEKATMAIDLFSSIENNKHVSLQDGRYLAECFCLMGRQDLVRKLNFVPGDIEEAMIAAPRILPFRILLYKISEDLSDKEYEQLKFYSGKTLKVSRKQLEMVKQVFDLFVLLEKRTFIAPTRTSVLKEMLRSLDRGDLLDLIDGYQEKYPQLMDCEIGGDSKSGPIPLVSETPVVDTSSSTLPEVRNNEPAVHVYEMRAYPRGYCIIINNSNFVSMKSRAGTDIDARKLNDTFQKLGFLTREHKDLTAKDMAFLMRDIALLDHSKFNALVVCILTHGGENCLYGIDEEGISVRYLTMFFRSSKCKTLANKPKLFFIQSCQGEIKQSGIAHTDLQQDGPSPSRESFLETDAETVSNNDTKITADELDFLIGFATVPGYVSFRSRSTGSFYIKKLTENLEKYASSLDLVTILTHVNNDVSAEDIPAGENGEISKQVPMPQFTLRKQLYFFPDNLPSTRIITQPTDARLDSIS